MKRYRLIRRRNPEDPFSLGTIAEICTGGYTTILDVDGKGKNLENYGFKWIIEYPEFWEEIIEYPIGTKALNSHTNIIYTKKEDGWYNPGEKTAYTDKQIQDSKNISVIEDKITEKEYEILSFVGTGTVFKKDSQLKDLYCVEDGRSPFHNEKWLLEANMNIHSIKRLSDGEIFTIGDNINGTIMKSKGVISKFVITSKNKVNVWRTTIIIPSETSELLNTIYKIKQPLFTTEDNIDVFEKYNFWFLQDLNSDHLKYWDWRVMSRDNDIYLKDKIKFLTKEGAEEYILMNKPCLSINDIILSSKMNQFSSDFGLSYLKQLLIDLVKFKL